MLPGCEDVDEMVGAVHGEAPWPPWPPGQDVSDGVVITRQEAEVIILIISLYRDLLSKTLPPAAPDIGHPASFLVEICKLFGRILVLVN